MKPKLEDVRIRAVEPLLSPDELKKMLPLPEEIAQAIAVSRAQIAEIIAGTRGQFLAIVGPCSIHDPEQGLVYARRLAEIRREVEDVMLVVMRVYFEKPRTTVGWKGADHRSASRRLGQYCGRTQNRPVDST